MAATLISRLLGFLRERAVADVFGRSAATDAYSAAFAIPDLMYFLLVGGALTAAFIPVFSGYLARGEEREGWAVASTFVNLTLLLLAGLTVAGMLLSPWLAPLVAYRFTGEQRELLVRLMRLTFPTVFFTAAAGLQTGILNSYRAFTAPAIGPLLYNAGIILGAYALGPRLGVEGMAWGAVAGAAANCAVQLPATLARNRGWRPSIDWHNPGVRRIAGLMGPSVLGLSAAQVNIIIGNNLASGLDEGSITALRLSNRLMQFPLGVFAMGISTAVFPTLAAQAARGDLRVFCRYVERGLRWILFLTLPAAAGLAVLAEPVVRLLFETGAFTPDDTRATARALVFYAPALAGLAASQILVRVFYSLQDTATPARIAVVNVVANTALSLLLLRQTGLGPLALALAFSASAWLNAGLYLVFLRRRLGELDLAAVGRRLGPVLGASLAAGAAALAATAWGVEAGSVDRPAGPLIEVGAGVAAGAAVYGLAGVLLRLPEIAELAEALRRPLLRRER